MRRFEPNRSDPPLKPKTQQRAAAVREGCMRRPGPERAMWGIASQRNISDSAAASGEGLIRFHRPASPPYNSMLPKKLTTIAVTAVAAIACYGAYDASAKG